MLSSFNIMWLTVILSVFIAVKLPVPVESTVEPAAPNTFLFYPTKLNEDVHDINQSPYVVNLPQIKKAFLIKNLKDQYFNKIKRYARPSNPEKPIPDFKTHFQLLRNWAPTNKNSKYTQQGEDDSFEPTQVLAQTRQIDSEVHLPRQTEDPRLREVIKDTKVHVEYTEDGYEDIGYDHAGEERHGETNEVSQSETNNPRYGKLQVDIEKEFDNYEKVNHDPETEETIHNNKPKRFVNDIPNIKIDEYLSNTQHTATAAPSTERYPYYKIKNENILSKHSALRYAVDPKNIPTKIAGDLSFYKHTGAFKCDKIPLEIDPVPSEEPDRKPSSIVKEPRLKNLGDKILCLKTMYFGENPFDNPLFSETNIETPQPFSEFIRNKRSLTTDAEAVTKNDLEEPLPESSPLRLRIRRRKYPVRFQRPMFRGDSYLPTAMPPLVLYTSTVIPKYKTISEVYYKEEIQPNEQLNVFADVMNNIKKTKTDLITADTEIIEDFQVEPPKNDVKIKVPTKRIKIRQSHSNRVIPESTTVSTTTTTAKLQTRRRNKYKNHKPDPQVYEEYVSAVKDKEVKLKKPVTIETSYDLVEPDLGVIGLSPPIVEDSTINVPLLPQSFFINTFPVTGMRPPISYYQPTYHNFLSPKQHNRFRRKNNFHIIHKRSVKKPAYSEIRRDKPHQAAESDDDDYVPNRNRNFHYDTVRKQVVYEKPEPEAYEEEVEEEVIVSTPTTTTSTTEAGPSFLDYVLQVKAHKQYQFIMEPTQKPKELTTTQVTTTAPKNAPLPDFLKLVSGLKQSDGYVVIPEKRPPTTTLAPVETEEKDEDRSEEFKVFDINEYLPTQENLPAVSIDYSKYKTIQRKPTNFISSSSEEDKIPEATEPSATTSTTTEAVPTTAKKIRSRTRRRPIATTSRSVESTTVSVATLRTRRRFRSTTQATTEAPQEVNTQSQRPARRRLPTRSIKTTQKVPSNHKEVYTPIQAIDGVPQNEVQNQKSAESQLLESESNSEAKSPKNIKQQIPELKLEETKVSIIKDPSKRLYYYAPVK